MAVDEDGATMKKPSINFSDLRQMLQTLPIHLALSFVPRWLLPPSMPLFNAKATSRSGPTLKFAECPCAKKSSFASVEADVLVFFSEPNRKASVSPIEER